MAAIGCEMLEFTRPRDRRSSLSYHGHADWMVAVTEDLAAPVDAFGCFSSSPVDSATPASSIAYSAVVSPRIEELQAFKSISEGQVLPEWQLGWLTLPSSSKYFKFFHKLHADLTLFALETSKPLANVAPGISWNDLFFGEQLLYDLATC